MTKRSLSFRNLQSSVRKISVSEVGVAASNGMKFWDEIFAYTLIGLELELVLISLRNRNKKMRRAANRALRKLEALKRSYDRVRAPLSEDAKSVWIERLKKCFS